MVRRAGRRAAWLAASLVTLSFALSAGLVLVIVMTGQDRDARAQLAAAAARADDVGDPPAGISLLLRHPDGSLQLSAAAPSVLPYRPGLTAVLADDGPAVQSAEVASADGDFRVLTQRRSGPEGVEIVQAASSLRPQQAEQARLIGGLLAAGALALVTAGLLGTLSGRQTARGLVIALRRQRQFIADASHELRTPLTLVSTRAQLLSRHLESSDMDPSARRELTADAERLLADSASLAQVVEDLLAASEPRPEETERVDLGAAAAEAVTSLAPLGRDRQIALVLEHMPSRGSQAGEVIEVSAGASPLRRSLVALIDNGIRHSPVGGTVTVTYGVRGSRGVLTVSDSGPGIPEQRLAQLFDRFSSGDRQADDGAGSRTRRRYGLGLALVADTLHRFDGDIGVESGLGGTTFTVTLPRSAPH